MNDCQSRGRKVHHTTQMKIHEGSFVNPSGEQQHFQHKRSRNEVLVTKKRGGGLADQQNILTSEEKSL